MKKIFLLFALLLILPFVAAVPPVTQIAQAGSLDIAYPQFQFIPQYTNFTLYIHVYNTTRYITGNVADCYLDLYDPDGNENMHNKMIAGSSDYYISVSKGNFSKIGEHAFIIQCNTSSQSGFANGVFEVNLTGTEVTISVIMIFIFFFLCCLALTYFSGKLAINNSFESDKIDYAKMYEEKKEHEGSFYLKLVKRKLWIVGVFGVYLSLVLFMAIFTQLVVNMSLFSFIPIFSNVTIIMLWGLVPFVIFWIVYIILFFYKSVEATLRHQFGQGAREK